MMKSLLLCAVLGVAATSVASAQNSLDKVVQIGATNVSITGAMKAVSPAVSFVVEGESTVTPTSFRREGSVKELLVSICAHFDYEFAETAPGIVALRKRFSRIDHFPALHVEEWRRSFRAVHDNLVGVAYDKESGETLNRQQILWNALPRRQKLALWTGKRLKSDELGSKHQVLLRNVIDQATLGPTKTAFFPLLEILENPEETFVNYRFAGSNGEAFSTITLTTRNQEGKQRQVWLGRIDGQDNRYAGEPPSAEGASEKGALTITIDKAKPETKLLTGSWTNVPAGEIFIELRSAGILRGYMPIPMSHRKVTARLTAVPVNDFLTTLSQLFGFEWSANQEGVVSFAKRPLEQGASRLAWVRTVLPEDLGRFLGAKEASSVWKSPDGQTSQVRFTSDVARRLFLQNLELDSLKEGRKISFAQLPLSQQRYLLIHLLSLQFNQYNLAESLLAESGPGGFQFDRTEIWVQDESRFMVGWFKDGRMQFSFGVPVD